MESFFNRPLVKNLAIALLVLLVVFTAAKAISELKTIKYIGSGLQATNVISVQGVGEILATPDIATFSFSVTEEAADVSGAQKLATEKMNAILAFVKKSNVDDKDVKTLGYNIYPRYEYRGGTMYTAGKQVLVAYVVSQTIEIKVRKLEEAGKLLSGIGEYGATNISGLTFSVDKQTDVERQARSKAITDAREQAEVLAKSLGVSLGRMVSFSESNYRPYPVYYAKAEMMSVGMGGDNAAPQVPSGENKITSNVSISYEIK